LGNPHVSFAPTLGKTALKWLSTGAENFPAMLAAIHAAKKTVLLETYTFSQGKVARQFVEALLAAARRGVTVRVLVDAAGSWFLPNNFFSALVASGAEVRRFNPLLLWRLGVRDHRKLLICDEKIAFLGGFNLADQYDGDGMTRGWFDVGVRVENSVLAQELAQSFEGLFALSAFHKKPLLRLRAFKHKRNSRSKMAGELLPVRPGRGASSFQNALYHDLAKARDVRIVSAYFLPNRRLRRDLMRVARQGSRVQLILPGKSDVPVSQFAARSLYHRLLKAGIEIYEYQPQILHAKLVLIDDFSYVGSSNLDIRSLNLNYELMLRLEDKSFAAEGRKIFERLLEHSKKIEHPRWWKTQGFLSRWKNKWAHFLLTRIDPLIALRQFRMNK
jgi:cardiolipin synthase A/B